MTDTCATAESRRFTLADLMIVTVALAVGLAPASAVVAHIADAFSRIPAGSRELWHADVLAWWWEGVVRRTGPRSWAVSGLFQLLVCFLAPIAPALLVARFRRPRPAIRALALQPGFIACALVCLSLFAAVDLAILQVGPIQPPLLAAIPGLTVAIAWSILAVTRHWRAESSWIDRAGRILGAAWITLTPALIWMAL